MNKANFAKLKMIVFNVFILLRFNNFVNNHYPRRKLFVMIKTMKIRSSCLYCGVGCRLIFETKQGKLVKVLPDQTDPVSQGTPCLKGLTLPEVVKKGRVKKPQIKSNGQFKEVTWKEALEFIYQKTSWLAPQEIFFSGSGKITNEDNFVLQKFARVVLKTNNIDNCCSRLCHQPTVQAMNDCFGTPNLTQLENLTQIDTLLIIGSNPASNYPAFWHRVLREKQKRRLKIVLVGSMFSLTGKNLPQNDQVLVLEQGSELVFLNGLANFLIKRKAFRPAAAEIEGFQRLVQTVKKFTPALVAKTCRLTPQEFLQAAETITKSKNLGLFHGMGLTQHVNGIENIHAFLNLVLLKKAFILTLRGEINVQGAGDMICHPALFFPSLWPGKPPLEKGKNIIEAFYLSPTKAAFISGFNPAQSLPDLKRVRQNLKKMFLVIITPYFNQTCEFAQVILPSPILIERQGTITNGERRVRLVRRVLPPYGEARPEWQIYSQLARLFGQANSFRYQNEKQILTEITKTIPDYALLKPEKIFAGEDGWVKKQPRHQRFYPEDWEGYDDPRSEKYPLLLTTFRQPFSFLTSEATEKSPTLKRASRKIGFYLQPKQAEALKIEDGDLIEVESTVNKIRGQAFLDENIPPGVVATSFHSPKLLVNFLFPLEFDEETWTPNFKATAVRIKKVSSPLKSA